MKKTILLLAAASALSIAGAAVAGGADGAKPAENTAAATPAGAPQMPKPLHFGSWGVDLTAMDKAVKPGDDFDLYANGAWFARTPIPADQASAGVGYDVFNLTQDQVRALIDNAPATTQIGAMYRSFVDEAGVEARGDAPLKADLAQVAAITDKAAFTRHMGQTSGRFGASIVSPDIYADPAKPTMNTLWIGQSGLGMPDRDYYLTEGFKPQRDAYRAYIERTFTMAGYPDAAKWADAVLAFETEIAKVSWAQADRREIEKINNPMSIAQLQSYAPGIDWDAYLTAAGIAKRDNAIINENSAIKAIAALYDKTPLDVLKAWQAFHVAHQAAPYLPKAWVDSRFAYTKTISGVDQLRPRWKRGAGLIDTTLGELLGRTYAETYFPAQSKTMMNELVANLKVAMKARIEGSDWMQPATKTAALEKLSRMDVMVGYPDKWRDYSGLKVDVKDLYGNVQRSGAFEWAYKLSDLDKPVDRKKWGMTPQTVNAYNGGLENKIVFPAGILQAPFFDPKADPAVNYGAIGAIIGHEISHGFDDQGRKIDADGAVRDWWTAQDAQRFNAEAAGFGKQYDGYEPVAGTHVNGQLTMGENIADMAGVLVALDAYHASLGGKPAPVIDGLTGDQRFFLAFAQAWRDKQRDDDIRQQVASDPHTPSKFRVIGPLRNVDSWYAAFGVKDGKYYLTPQQRAHIW